MAWQKNALLPNLDDITSLVLNLVRTEVAAATPAFSGDRARHYVPQCNMKHKGPCTCRALGKSDQKLATVCHIICTVLVINANDQAHEQSLP